MSVRFVSGKPGGGKSLYALKLCFDELLYGFRPVVTNLAIKIGELNAYYQEHYDDPVNLIRFRVPWWLNWLFWILPEWMLLILKPVCVEEIETRIKRPRLDDICSRVHLITDDEMGVFFTKRPACEIEHVENSEWKRGKRPDYSVVNDSGVFFCLDEIHIAFNSRAWADTGAEVLFYLSQHRKLGDDVICITQSVANVDKQFRSVAQDFTYLRNLGKEVAGLFRLPLRFVRKTYSQPPVGDSAKPMDWGIFRLDASGLASCYDTAKGIGIHGRAGADTKERKRGFHWGWFVVGVPVILICFVHFCPNVLVRFLGHGAPKSVYSHQATSTLTAHGDERSRVLEKEAAETNSSAADEKQVTGTNSRAVDEKEVYVTGYVVLAGKPQVFLSDGTVVRLPRVSLISEDFVIVDGKRMPVRFTRPEYVERPVPVYELPSALPDRVQNVQVTVIGKDPHQPVPRLNGFSSMAQSQGGQQP